MRLDQAITELERLQSSAQDAQTIDALKEVVVEVIAVQKALISEELSSY